MKNIYYGLFYRIYFNGSEQDWLDFNPEVTSEQHMKYFGTSEEISWEEFKPKIISKIKQLHNCTCAKIDYVLGKFEEDSPYVREAIEVGIVCFV